MHDVKGAELNTNKKQTLKKHPSCPLTSMGYCGTYCFYNHKTYFQRGKKNG
jgi:hypothetical protein